MRAVQFLSCALVLAALGSVLALDRLAGSEQQPRRPQPTGPQWNDEWPAQQPRPAPVELGPCLPPEVVEGARIAVFGAYEGRTKSSLNLGDAAAETGIIAISGSDAEPATILVLSAYDPVVWDLRKVPAGRVRAVIAYGYSDQGVVGLPTEVPVRFVSHSAADGSCGRPAYAYERGPDLDRLAQSVAMATGRKIESFAGGYDPVGFSLDGGPSGGPGSVIDPEAVRAAGSVSRDTLAPGQEGIATLLRDGAIRLATDADAARLSRAIAKASPIRYFAPVDLQDLGPEVYVVTRPTAVPKGMHGAHSAIFLVEPGVPLPRDAGSHNTYYLLADGSCRGPFCDD